MTTKYFNVKNGLSVGSIIADASNSNVSANTFIGNLEVTSLANLGSVANVTITGGANGYFLKTDGNGNLSFTSSASTQSPAPMPTYVPVGTDLSISANYQGIYSVPIVVDGSLTVDGVLVQVDGIVGSSNTQIIFNDYGTTTGNANLTFDKSTGTLTTVSLDLSGTANLGAVSNVKISGGSSGQVLSTDGAGNLSWVAQTGGESGNVVIDNYTGNGVQTEFTLSVTPTSENETIVNIDGIIQLHTSYTLSGDVLTLSAAPVNGSLIEISTLNLGGGGGGGGGGNSTPGGSTTQVQFNDAGSFAGNTGFTFNKTTGTLTSTYFSGAGNALSNIQGANVSGAVGLATYATTANAVAGANVSGQVSYAAVANSIAAANITGSIASATSAGTVTTAAQPNITSVGTLTSLTATGNIQGNYFIGNGSQLTGLSVGLSWSIASSNATMTANNGYFVDTSAGAKTMTLPSSAVIGDIIRINDLAGTFGTNNLTVARNGGNIQGVAQDLVVSVNQSSFGLVYSNSTYGWKLLEL